MAGRVNRTLDAACECPALERVGDSFLPGNVFLPGYGGYDKVLVKKAYFNITARLNQVNGYDGVLDKGGLTRLFSETLDKIQKIEADNAPRLQELCKQACLGVFDTPGSTVTVDCHLGTSVDVDGPSPMPQPENYLEVFEDGMVTEVMRREIMDCLAYGAAHCIYEKFHGLLADAAEVSPELPRLYRDILVLYDALHLVEVTDFKAVREKRVRLFSFSKLVFHGDGNQPTVDSYAVCFPLLAIETLKGLCELFISHGLPDEVEDARDVLEATDCLDKEQWYHIAGPVMWRLIMQNAAGLDTSEVPYVMTDLSEMDNREFRGFLSTVLLDTPHAEDMVSQLMNHARRGMEYDVFNESIDRKNREFEKKMSI